MNSTLRNPLLLAGGAILLVVIAILALRSGSGQPAERPLQATVTATSLASNEVPTLVPQPTATNPVSPISPLATPAASETENSLFLPAVDRDNSIPTSEPQAEIAAAETPTPAPEPTATPTEEPWQMKLQDLPAIALADWPRPANDNGLCIHNITEAYYHEENLDLQISRLKRMNMPWTLLLYGDEFQIMKAAPRFRDAGIMVVWRKMLRPDERYYEWQRDIDLIRSYGMEPYMQIYNEPSLPAEWGGGEPNQSLFMENFLQSVEYVYNAGGYVGLQFVSDEWLVAALQAMKLHGGEQIFGRTFLIPHPYGLNHPPDYTEDPNGVLGFLQQAEIVRNEIGFVPPMIAGEGGWKWNATDDRRYPAIDVARHRDYHVAVFDWFRSGILSNGEPLPDTLFAFCPWLLSSKLDDSAWFDSFAGDHTPTIEAVEAMAGFVRKFSWE